MYELQIKAISIVNKCDCQHFVSCTIMESEKATFAYCYVKTYYKNLQLRA